MAEPSLEKATSAPPEVPTEAKEAATASVEAAKTEAAAASQKLADTVLPQVKDAVDGAVSRGIEGAKSLLQSLDDKKGEVSSKLLGALKGATHAAGGASGSADTATAASDGERSRELPISTDNQPLIASAQRALEATPWWKNCCGVLDLLKTSSR